MRTPCQDHRTVRSEPDFADGVVVRWRACVWGRWAPWWPRPASFGGSFANDVNAAIGRHWGQRAPRCFRDDVRYGIHRRSSRALFGKPVVYPKRLWYPVPYIGAVLLRRTKYVDADGDLVELVLWQVPRSAAYPDGLRYRWRSCPSGSDSRSCSTTTTTRKGTTATGAAPRNPIRSPLSHASCGTSCRMCGARKREGP